MIDQLTVWMQANVWLAVMGAYVIATAVAWYLTAKDHDARLEMIEQAYLDLLLKERRVLLGDET